MGIEKLVATLEREASAREEATMAEAREEAGKILEKAKAQAKEMDARIKRLSRELEERRQLIKSAAEKLHKRKKRTSLENIYIEATRKRTRELYRDFMKKPAYGELLKMEYAKIKKELGAIGEIRADDLTAKALKDAHLPEKIIQENAPEDGFVALSADGRRRIFCTFEQRFQKFWSSESPRFVRLIAKSIPDE